MRMNLQNMLDCLGTVQESFLPEEARAEVPAGFCIDSREALEGKVFVCIPGLKADGHDFAAEAAKRGALAILAQRDVFDGIPPLPVLRAPDSVAALGRLAACARDSAGARLIGITGTAGKTSVKEVLAQVLSVRGPTAKNLLNRNNQIGLPLSMLGADPQAAFWVMEAGISEARDMDELGAIMRPDLAIILNVGQGHLSGLGERGVAYYKARLLAHLAPDAQALISADYPDLVREAAAYGRKLTYFSTRRGDVDYSASYLGPASAATGRYRVNLRGKACEVVAPFRGSFGSENVAAIAGAAHMCGLSPEELALGLSGAALPAQRFCCSSQGDLTLIDDSYNANPLSSSRMLEAAQEMAAESGRPLVLVMGEMLELGAESQSAHLELGRRMARSGAERIFWKGGQKDAVAEGLAQTGFAGFFAPVFDKTEFRALMEKQPLARAVILFKGSRGNRLEELAAVFKEMHWKG